MSKRIDIWYDATSDASNPVWCVSLCADDGEEIKCLDTADTYAEAKQIGEREASDRRLVLMDCVDTESRSRQREEQASRPTNTISVSWDSEGGGRLIAKCNEDQTLGSNTVKWSEPITAKSDSWAIARAVTEINGAEIIGVDHDGDRVHVTVDGSVSA